MTNRRVFIVQLTLGSGALAAGSALAQGPMVAPNDSQAVALGYTPDATKANKAKFPQYAAGQECANCAVYQGKAGDPAGGCPLFAGKQVAAKGWCSSWVKKA